MRKSSAISFVLLLGFAAWLITLSAGCANIIPPSGGPRDTLPPVLQSVTPPDSTVNFRADRVTFEFDEYLDDPQDLQNNILFTPIFEVNPEIAVRARTLTVRFRDTLQPNTTYILNFGNAIRDINEGNVLRNFVYSFSTGPALDTITLAGRVDVAETGKTDSTMIVMLHRDLRDSAVFNRAPVYVARVDANGNFRFRNLPRDTFAIYALGEPGLMRRYQRPANQLFAFSDSLVVTGTTRDVTLHAFKAAAPATTTSTTRTTTANDNRLRITTTPASGTLDLQSDYVLNFQSPLRAFDSTLVSLTTDSAFNTTPYNLFLDSTRTALHFRSQWRPGTLYNIILDRDFADDSAGRKLLKTDTLHFTTKTAADYGRLVLRLRNVDTSRNPVLQFIQNDKVVASAPIKSGIYRSDLFVPGEYDLRILFDTNGNGQWDPGQFFGTRRQPELTQPITRRITVKAAWDNEFEIPL